MNRKNITLNPKYASLRIFIESIPAIFEEEGTYIYGGRRNLIKRFTAPDGTELNVKRYCVPRWFNRFVYSIGLRKPKGRRAFDYSGKLLSKGIETPESVAYIEFRNGIGLLNHCYFISIQCPYEHTMYEMKDATPALYEPVADMLATFTVHMHEQEVLHMDFSPGNILWRDGGEMCIVDINRMKFGKVDMKEGLKSLRRLWGPKPFFILLVRRYAALRGFDPDKAEQTALTERAHFWKRYLKNHQLEFNVEL